MLEKLARWSYRNRWRVVAIWIVALVAIGFAGTKFRGPYSMNFSLPGSQSQEAFDILKSRFPARSGDTAEIVFKADSGIQDPSVKQTMEGFLAQVARLPHVVAVISPYSPQGSRQVSRDGRIAFADVQYNVQSADIPKAQILHMLDLGKSTERSGLQIEFAGGPIQQAQFEPPGGAEFVGTLAAIIILLITFGSVLAMGLPIITALFGIAISLALVLLSAHFLNVPNFTPQLSAMIGLGVGIDYALFIVTRYRQGLGDGLTPEAAVVRAMATSGRAVLFAGIIVVISFLGILLMGFAFVQGIAVGGAAAVFVTMVASITLVPALLGFLGRNIDKWHIPRLRRVESAGRQSFWYRWSRLIQRRPWPAAIIGLAALLVLATPLFKMRLGLADAGSDPEHLTTRRAHDLLVQGFGPGFDTPIFLVAELNGPQGLQPLSALSQAVQSTPGVALATQPFPNNRTNPTAAIITVYPAVSSQDAAASDLVRHLRNSVIPQAMRGTGVPVLVGGVTGILVDFTVKIAQRLPILIAVVIGLSFLLLMVVFRSILVPIKAAIMNLLSIGASFGVIVAIFQWGWLGKFVGIGKPGPIEAFVPMMLFTILFGLSMDYEIFLLSRIREDYLRTRDNALSVANGVANTGRVITAAAAIMIAVFLSFVLGFDIRQIKLFGLGLAVAVLVDATLVRMVLVPATMELIGDANWWYPKWLGRVTPRLSVEEAPEEPVLEPVGV